MKVLALLVPPAVTTVAFRLPDYAFAGTRHLMLVALRETCLLTSADVAMATTSKETLAASLA